MNFFNRNRGNARPADTQQPSSTSPLPLDPVPVNHIPLARTFSNSSPSKMPLPTSPSSIRGTKRDVLSRVKAVFNKPSKNTTENSQTAASPDPAKIARREARRAAREKALQEWEEEDRRRRKDAMILCESYEPLPKPPHVPSDSEDEGTPVISASMGSGPVMSAKNPVPDSSRSISAQHLQANVQPISGGGETYMATVGTHLTTGAPPSQQMAVTNVLPPSHPQYQPAQVQGGRNDAHLADSFGIQAYMGVDAQTAEAYTRRNGMPVDEHHDGSKTGSAIAPVGKRGAEITHVGWGDTYGYVTSVPVYGNPGRAPMGPTAGMQDADFELTKKIRKGREFGRLAVEQEEKGNLGAAESGYMRALEFLVPAIKELDVGGELNKPARMSMKKKVKREATAMLDRVEELKVFLKANGPAVPSELPPVPGKLPIPPTGSFPPPAKGSSLPHPKQSLPPPPRESLSPPPKQSLTPPPKQSLTPPLKQSLPPPPKGSLPSPAEGPSPHHPERALPPPQEDTKDIEDDEARKNAEKELEEQRKRMDRMTAGPPKGTTMISKPPSIYSSGTSQLKRPPPPPPPPAFSHDSEDLLKRLVSRHEIFSSVSGGFGAVLRTAGVKGLTENPGSKPPKKGASCFMCGGVADLVAPCDHTFCELCGKQVVEVFQRCPVPDCGEPLSMETCFRIQ